MRSSVKLSVWAVGCMWCGHNGGISCTVFIAACSPCLQRDVAVMAFLCPSRLGGGKERRKKKGEVQMDMDIVGPMAALGDHTYSTVKSTADASTQTNLCFDDISTFIDEREPLFGRITGSDSVDTLVRVGMEKQHGLCPESKMVAVQGFTACADRELSLDLGQAVYVLYKENGWAYVLTEDNREGFVPLSYIAACGGSRAGRSVSMLEIRETDPLSHVVESECRSSGNTSFAYRKQSYGRYVVVFDFDSSDENDLSVEHCELVTVLNMEDPDWYWVVRSTGEEGFVPTSYLCPFPADLAFKEDVPGNRSAASSHSLE